MRPRKRTGLADLGWSQRRMEARVQFLKMKTDCKNFVEDQAICDSQGDPKGQCVNCGYKWDDHDQSALPPEPTPPEYALAIAMDHLSRSKRPKENWPQFLSLVKSTGVFGDDQIKHWNDEYNS
jgi:hypothetical protein